MKPSAYKVRKVLDRLAETYPDARTALDFETPWQLLVATMLSAQSTDKRVNLITPRIFGRYPDAKALKDVSVEEMEAMIHDSGLYRTKARNILATARIVAEQFDNRVPEDLDTLITLPGVGRKTANVVLSVAFGRDAIAVDTHVFRVSHRLGWSDAKDPLGCERDLMAVLPRRLWSKSHHWLIWHGRLICRALRPECPRCPVARWCPRLGLGG